MELNKMISELLASGIVENQNLGANLMRSPDMPADEKQKHIDDFVEKYNSGKINFFSQEHEDLFRTWMELYSQTIINEVKTRVKKI